MVLAIMGVNHFDPLGRAELLERLRALALCHRDAPAFVAVEYDEQQFSFLSGQRDSFRARLEAADQDMSTLELAAYTESLAYEGDCHREVFPDLPVLWLDQGRNESESALDGYAQQRYTMYLGHAEGCLSGAIKKVSRAIRALDGVSIDSARSRVFAKRIHDYLRDSTGSWAIIIVGEKHASNSVEGSMRQVLEAAELNCVTA